MGVGATVTVAVATVGGATIAVGTALILVLVATEEAGGTGKQVTQGALVLVFLLGRATGCAAGEALGGASEHSTGRTGLSSGAIATHVLVWLVDVDGLVLIVDIGVLGDELSVGAIGLFEYNQGLASVALGDFKLQVDLVLFLGGCELLF